VRNFAEEQYQFWFDEAHEEDEELGDVTVRVDLVVVRATRLRQTPEFLLEFWVSGHLVATEWSLGGHWSVTEWSLSGHWLKGCHGLGFRSYLNISRLDNVAMRCSVVADECGDGLGPELRSSLRYPIFSYYRWFTSSLSSSLPSLSSPPCFARSLRFHLDLQSGITTGKQSTR